MQLISIKCLSITKKVSTLPLANNAQDLPKETCQYIDSTRRFLFPLRPDKDTIVTIETCVKPYNNKLIN